MMREKEKGRASKKGSKRSRKLFQKILHYAMSQ